MHYVLKKLDFGSSSSDFKYKDVKLFALVDLIDLDLLLKVTKGEGNNGVEIIIVNVISPDHVDDVPIIEPNQHDDVLVVPKHVLVDEDDDPKEEEFEEEEEDDMEVDIEEDENEPELTYPYEEVNPLNPLPPASESEPEDVSEAKNPIEHEDETVLASVLRKEKKRTSKLILDLGNEVRSSVEQRTAAMEKLVEKLGNAEDKVECKKLKKELKEARLSNTFLRIQNERVERDLYWTRVRAHEFYQEMIRRGFMFEERPNEAIDVSIEDEKSPSIMPPKSAPLTQVAIRRMIKENVDVAIAAKFEKTESVFRISECAKGKKVKFAAATLQGPVLTWWNAKVATMGLETVNQMPWTKMKQLMTAEFCEVTSSKPANLNEAVLMAHKLMEHKLQARDERILEGKKQKWENFQSGNSSEEEDDMEVDIEEDENEPELTYPYEEVDPLNPPPHASESEPEDAIEVENLIKHEDETFIASVHETVVAILWGPERILTLINNGTHVC
nr:putative reverse transcriptase domain-containing protein [Tanacetum cinerariifolium]